MHSSLRLGGLLLAVIATTVPVCATPLEDADQALMRGDYSTAVRLYEGLAAGGDAIAQLRLATLYKRGEGLPNDPAKAFQLYSAAAAQGNAEAEFNLGNMYLLGEGVAQDDGWALTYYRQAALQGHALAQKNVREFYRAAGLTAPEFPSVEMSGNISPSMPIPAVPPPGIAPAPTAAPAPAYSEDEMHAIQIARAHGIEVELDGATPAPPEFTPAPPRSITPSVPAPAMPIEVPVPPAISRTLPADQDLPQSQAELETLANAGNAAAQYRLYRRSAGPRHPDVQSQVALQWLQRAAAGGYPQAQYELAERYMRGDAVTPDEASAVTLYRAAARAGHQPAREKLEAIYREAGLPLPDLSPSPASPVEHAPMAPAAAADNPNLPVPAPSPGAVDGPVAQSSAGAQSRTDGAADVTRVSRPDVVVERQRAHDVAGKVFGNER